MTVRTLDIIADLERDFPVLKKSGYEITEEWNEDFNCVAWALGLTDAAWWPGEGRYWPTEVPRTLTLESFIAVFATVGYTACENGRLEPGFQKIAIYVLDGIPRHATRQLVNGKWTSKIGKGCTIIHNDADALQHSRYGSIMQFLKRPRSAAHRP